jgi:hypothetical protein
MKKSHKAIDHQGLNKIAKQWFTLKWPSFLPLVEVCWVAMRKVFSNKLDMMGNNGVYQVKS